MAWGVAGVLTPTVEHLTARVSELQKSQQLLIESLDVQRRTLTDIPGLKDVYEVMARVPAYQAKVARIKQVMGATTSQLKSLQKQVDGWQTQIEKGENAAKARRAKEAQLDEELAAKPAASLVASGAGEADAGEGGGDTDGDGADGAGAGSAREGT